MEQEVTQYGQYVGLQASDECAACLMAKERTSEAKSHLMGDAVTSLKEAMAAVKALIEEHFVSTELKFGEAEQEEYHVIGSLWTRDCAPF